MKIAVYGGAFNPVHLGHIEIVKFLSEKTDFDKILIIPSKFSPHKSNEELVDDVHRMNMCKLSFESIDKCEVSDIEIKRDKISYTIDTLVELKTIYPFDDLYLVCGSDMFLSLLNWRKPDEILKRASVFAFIRDNESIDIMNEQKQVVENKGVKVEICEIKVPPYSSTQVRDAIKEGKTFENYISNEVYEYILENNLYK